MSDDVLDLLERAPAPAMTIDPYAAVLGGRRRLRRRRASFAAAGAAAAVLVVGVALSVVGGLPTAVSPAGTTPAPGSGATAVLDFGDTAYTVRLVETGTDEDRLEFGVVGQSGTGGSSVPHTGGRATYGYSGEGSKIVMGVVPTGGDGLSAWFGPGQDAGWEQRRERIPGTPYDAFAVKLLGDQTAADLRAIDWRDASGRWATTGESDDTTAVFTSKEGEIVRVWATGDGTGWGVGWGGMQADLAGAPASGTVRYADNGVSSGGPGTTPAWGAFGLLPAGSTDVTLRMKPGTHAGTVGVRPLGRFTVWFAEILPDGGAVGHGDEVEGVSWTDKAGQPQTLAE